MQPQIDLLPAKLNDHQCEREHFLQLLDARCLSLRADAEVAAGFRHEMRRFLPGNLVAQTVDQAAFWTFLTGLVNELCKQARLALALEQPAPGFRL